MKQNFIDLRNGFFDVTRSHDTSKPLLLATIAFLSKEKSWNAKRNIEAAVRNAIIKA